MSKNIVIEEGRRGRRFGSLRKIKTRLQGGGDCLWVPEDDVQLDSLYAYENGVYRPEKYGFGDVSVSVVDATLAPMNTVHNNPSFPPAGTDGFSKVTVNVPDSEQDTYMDAIQLKCLDAPSDKPFSWVTMTDIYDPQMDNAHTRASSLFQSSFPPFIQGSGEKANICGFVRGENSLRVHVYWEHWMDVRPGTYLPHAYLIDCMVDYSDNFTTNVTSFGGHELRSRRENGVDILEDAYTSGVSRIVNEGSHLGVMRPKGTNCAFFKQDSVAEELPDGDLPSRQVIGVVPPRNNGYYSCNYWTTDTLGFKVINGMNFSTMEEWLTWCKTH